MVVTISRTDLAKRTREIVEQVQQGQTIIVESGGEQQIVLLDMLDYRILRALAAFGANAEPLRDQPDIAPVIGDYLSGKINLGKAAELLGVSRFELMERFQRLGVPLRIGPATLDEARAEVAAAQGNQSVRDHPRPD